MANDKPLKPKKTGRIKKKNKPVDPFLSEESEPELEKFLEPPPLFGVQPDGDPTPIPPIGGSGTLDKKN